MDLYEPLVFLVEVVNTGKRSGSGGACGDGSGGCVGGGSCGGCGDDGSSGSGVGRLLVVVEMAVIVIVVTLVWR